VDGARFKAPLTGPHFDTVMEAFNSYRPGIRIRMHVTGRFNRANRLQGIESVEHISILDPLDIGVRIEELKLLERGWLNGKGLPPPPAGLDWLAGVFDREFPADLPLPYLYPTAEGGVRAEWCNKPYELSLEIDLKAKVGTWHALNLDDDTENARPLKLDDTTGWDWLAEEVRRLVGVNA
jgi:hypothetical protein